MDRITSVEALEELYKDPMPRSLTKVQTQMTPLYRQWIEASRFCIVSTVGPEGTDASPRGDKGPVARVMDDKTIWMPDWRGNNRIDTLKNIVRDSRGSLMFMVPGSSNVVRINGTMSLTADPEVTEQFTQAGQHPKTVIVTEIGEMYFQCAKAIMRSGLWTRDDGADVPTAGMFVKEYEATFDAESYDRDYEAYAKPRMW